jgi:hypothetical protein
VLVLIAAVMEDPRSGVMAALLLGACAPVYGWIAHRRKRAASASEASIEVGR